MPSTAPSSAEARELRRFSRATRLVHRTLAVLMIVCIVTAFLLYYNAIQIGHRHLVQLVHVYCGFALPVAPLLGLLSPAYRDDLSRLNRFLPGDWQWLRSRTRRDGRIRVGKFNAGQKLNTALTASAVLVLLGTGVLMQFTGLVRLSWRSGSTFVHDWFALALGLLVVGHVLFALRDPEARRGMRQGGVSVDWARTHHADWVAELEHQEEQ